MDAAGSKEVNPFDHAVKRRAGAACTRCQSRKVRCDLTIHGSPCTNCKLDGMPCTTRPSRRQRYGPISTLELVSRNELLSTDGRNLGLQMIHQIGLETRTISKHKDHISNNVVSENIKTSTNQPASSNSPDISKGPASRLPSHFKPPPSFMIPEDVDHLSAVGAFSTPSNGLRDALLQSFLDYVHPLNAVLDVQDLFAMEGLTGDGTVSLLVFYTVMLGGSLFVDIKHLIEAGYPTRRAARQSFYQKSKAVYDTDYEQDKLCIAQALSLLSLWWETPSGHKGCWYWSGLAINLLHLVFLDNRRDETKLTGKWRRLWWSCFIRDRTIGLGMKLPVRLSIVDYGMEVLELDDFDLEGATTCHLSLKGTTKLSWCPEKFRGLYTLCIEEAKLCICMDHLICVGRIEPLDFESKIRELQSCDRMLQNWRSQLPEVAALGLDVNVTPDSNSILVVHHATLRMMSYCVYAFIQRTYLILNPPDSEPLKVTVLEMQNSSRTNISLTADTMSKIAKELQDRGLIGYMPHSAVFSFVLVALMYLLDLTAVNDIEGISQSIHMMHFFRESYFDTEYMSRTVNLVFKRESIRRISHSGQFTLPDPNTSSSKSTPEDRNVSYDSLSHEWDIGPPAEISNPLNPSTFELQANDTRMLMQPSQVNLQVSRAQLEMINHRLRYIYDSNSLREAPDGSLDVDGLKNLDALLASNEVNIDDMLMNWLNNEWPTMDWNLEPLPEGIETTLQQSQA